MLVPASEEEGHSEGSQASELGVGLLVVADRAHHLLHRHRLLEVVQVPLRADSRSLDEDVGISRESRHQTGGVVVDDIGLLTRLRGCQELGHHSLLGSEDYAIYGGA